jgi:type I restriction enzyme S subunit
MTALLTDNLPLLSGAPNGIKKLRELILELGVRGKLVPQDSSDEPSSKLVKRIAEEKARLVAEGKIKKQKPLTEITPEEKPFNLPVNWEWVRVAAVGHDWGQKTPDREFTYIDVGSVDNATGLIQSPQIVAAEDAPSRARKIVRPGTVIYSTIRPYLLNVAVIDEQYEQEPIASTAFAVIHPYLGMPSQYFLWYLRSPVFVRYVESVQMGIAYPAINDGQFFSGLIPLPPLSEQHRIVAKVDELMALCDRLEAQQADAESAHAQLVQALLDSLTQASDATDFAANWQRLSEHFHTLFTTEPSIDALKQTLLQLAVMGKLVPQDRSDEPAGELLKRIQAEKQRLVAAGELKKQKPLDEIREEEKIFSLPLGWEWVRFGTTIKSLTNGLYKPAGFYTDDGVISLRMYNIQDGYITLEGVRRVVVTDGELDQFKLEGGDLLINRVNSKDLVGKTAIIPCMDEPLIYESMNMRARPYVGLVASLYLNLFMRTSFAKVSLLSHAKEAVGQASLNQGQISSLAMPLPPLAEQHRIVAKLDQLMALCDQLKTRLTQARQLNEQLASTLVEQAVA